MRSRVGNCWLHISSLINGGALGRAGVSEPTRRCWESRERGSVADLSPLHLPPLIIYAHDKVPPSPPSHLLEMSLHVHIQQASRDGMKMGINANENWAFISHSQWLFPSFPCPNLYSDPISLPFSPVQTNPFSWLHFQHQLTIT